MKYISRFEYVNARCCRSEPVQRLEKSHNKMDYNGWRSNKIWIYFYPCICVL